MTRRRSASPPRRARWIVLAWLLATGILGVIADPSSAQSDLSDVFGDLGTSKVVLEGDDEPVGDAMRPGDGAVAGKVFDGESGTAVQGASVILVFPAPADGSAPRQEVEITDIDGHYAFPSVPPGRYSLTFVKSGFRTSAMTDFAVEAGNVHQADFPMPRLPTSAGGEVLQLDAFVVEAAAVGEMMTALELRMDSDQVLEVMTAADFSKFAASDVSEALRRVAGVNVVEGQFAIVRGLEDRYSSTLFNGAPVPSPDPDRQSVQLDLFPSDVVSNLTLEKTFHPAAPSNSSAGSINILTDAYPEEIEAKVQFGAGFNENALDTFLAYQGNSAVGNADSGIVPVEHDASFSLGGRKQLGSRELRGKLVAAYEVDMETAFGWQESREPRPAATRNFPRPPTTTRSGDLSLGKLGLTGGRFDLVESEFSEQTTAFGGLGVDLDEAGRHRVDASVLYTKKLVEIVQERDRGYLPGFDYSTLAAKQASGQEIQNNADFDGFATFSSWIARTVRGDPRQQSSRGPLWYANFAASSSFVSNRDLLVTQLNGAHEFDVAEGLEVSWATNFARSTQQDESLGLRYFFEPDDPSFVPSTFPVDATTLAPGRFAANNGIFQSFNDIEESQGFGRLDAKQQLRLFRDTELELSSGLWYEQSNREVQSDFLQSPSVSGSSQFAIEAATPGELGRKAFTNLDTLFGGPISGTRSTTNDALREVIAGHFGAKLVLREQIDLLGGVRIEQLEITSNNEPFTGELALDGSPAIFPTKYLFFDRLDNPARNEVSQRPPPGTTFNDQLLGILVPVDPVTGLVDLPDTASIESLVNGRIDELRFLPAAGLAYRPLEGLTLRAAYSQTTARPSFREMGFYVSVEPGTDDLFVGNPQLQLSDVDSFDVRAEYVWGEEGDVVAASGFVKTIDLPIESIVVRDPLNLDGGSSALYRTFFNNNNQADLWGIEFEFRKGFGFLDVPVIRWMSLGGNFTYIDAQVGRSDIELGRANRFFGTAPGDVPLFEGLAPSRRLFGQPEWIVNTDLSFENVDWGSRITLAYFAISDILDAAGSASVAPDGLVQSITLDRYIDSFYTLDLIMSQTFPIPWLADGDLTLKASIKNLTDSTRRVIYDPYQTCCSIPEREFKVGRDYSFSLGYQIRF